MVIVSRFSQSVQTPSSQGKGKLHSSSCICLKNMSYLFNQNKSTSRVGIWKGFASKYSLYYLDKYKRHAWNSNNDNLRFGYQSIIYLYIYIYSSSAVCVWRVHLSAAASLSDDITPPPSPLTNTSPLRRIGAFTSSYISQASYLHFTPLLEPGQLELETKVREVFTITSKAPTRDSSFPCFHI